MSVGLLELLRAVQLDKNDSKSWSELFALVSPLVKRYSKYAPLSMRKDLETRTVD